MRRGVAETMPTRSAPTGHSCGKSGACLVHLGTASGQHATRSGRMCIAGRSARIPFTSRARSRTGMNQSTDRSMLEEKLIQGIAHGLFQTLAPSSQDFLTRQHTFEMAKQKRLEAFADGGLDRSLAGNCWLIPGGQVRAQHVDSDCRFHPAITETSRQLAPGLTRTPCPFPSIICYLRITRCPTIWTSWARLPRSGSTALRPQSTFCRDSQHCRLWLRARCS